MKYLYFSDVNGLSYKRVALWRHLVGSQLELFTPYDALPKSTTSEKSYDAFMALIGFDNYVAFIQSKVAEYKDIPTMLIGESVGATALWKLTAEMSGEAPFTALMLCGSRIRDHLHSQPNIAADVLFSSDELYFRDQFEAAIEYPHITHEFLPYSHGFINPDCSSFNKDGVELVRQRLLEKQR